MVSPGGRFTTLQKSQGINTEFYVKQKLSISVAQKILEMSTGILKLISQNSLVIPGKESHSLQTRQKQPPST